MSETASSIPTDELFNGLDDDTSAFLSNLTNEADPRKEAVSKPEEVVEEDAPETDEPASAPETEEGDAPSEGEEKDEPPADPDDLDEKEVTVKQGDQEHKVKVKDLRRLFGQEAALTQRSQALAADRTAADTKMATATAALTKLLENAQAAAKPYEELDFLALSMTPQFQADPTAFAALRADASAAQSQVKFLETELGTLMESQEAEKRSAYQKAAKECVAALSDPKTGITGWGPQMYQEVTKFANEHGLPAFGNNTDPGVYKIAHMAMQWQKHQAAQLSAASKVKTAAAKPTSTLKPKAGTTSQPTSAMNKLRRSGSQDDAVDAFLASFG